MPELNQFIYLYFHILYLINVLSANHLHYYNIMEGELRKFEMYFNEKNYCKEFPTTYKISDVQNYIRNNPEFIHQLQEHGKTRIPENANLAFRYNSRQAEPSLKSLKLNEFHPKKRLLFYVTEDSSLKPKSIHIPVPEIGFNDFIIPKPRQIMRQNIQSQLPILNGNLNIPSTNPNLLKKSLQFFNVSVKDERFQSAHIASNVTEQTTVQAMFQSANLNKTLGADNNIIYKGQVQNYKQIAKKSVKSAFEVSMSNTNTLLFTIQKVYESGSA